MPKPKKQPKEGDRHKKKPTAYRFDPELVDLMKELGRRNRRSATAEIEVAMQEHAEKAGLWPPK